MYKYAAFRLGMSIQKPDLFMKTVTQMCAAKPMQYQQIIADVEI
jgi:hypothetical protein